MPLPDPPALTVGDVYHLGGWDVRYARVYALGSVGHVACSVTDTNGDRRELSSDYWRYEANGWTDAGGWATATIGGGGSDGILHWSDDHDEYSAIYRLDDQTEPPALDRINVGELTIASTPIPRTLPAIVGGLRERATAATAMSGGGSVDEELALVLVLLDSGEEAIALTTLCAGLANYDVILLRSEFVELAREAARLELLEDDWNVIDRLVQD